MDIKTNHLICSFILPIYNVKDFIEDCIISIVNQDIQNYEIICIDDKSVDGTVEKLDELKNKYPIKILKNDRNYGVCYSRNKGLDNSNAKYVWFIDPDDLLVPGIAQQYLDEALNSNADYVFGNYKKVEEDYVLLEKTSKCRCNFKRCDFSFKIPTDENGIDMNAVWAGPFKREFLLSNNLYFKEGLIAQEDTLFYFELKEKDIFVSKTEEVGYLYRQRNASIMHERSDIKNKNYFKSMLQMLSIYEKYLSTEKVRDKNVLKEKIHQTKENIVWTLAMVQDEKFVEKEYRGLLDNHIYPYKLRWHVLSTSRPLTMRLMLFLLPIKPNFWIIHKLWVSRK